MISSRTAIPLWPNCPCAHLAAIAATALGDHRVAYLDYEGPVSGNRGTVRRWDHGSYEATSTPGEFILHGTRVQGRARLRQVHGEEWVFTLS